MRTIQGSRRDRQFQFDFDPTGFPLVKFFVTLEYIRQWFVPRRYNRQWIDLVGSDHFN